MEEPPRSPTLVSGPAEIAAKAFEPPLASCPSYLLVTPMTKTYIAPEVVELGAVEELTAALGNESRVDFSTFPAIPASMGSFDICPNNTIPGQC